MNHEQRDAYTDRDHRFRSRDPYAGAKYELTEKWLGKLMRPGTRLVNIGCGAGEYNAWARRRGVEVVACEPDPEAFAQAKQRTQGDAGCELHPCGLLELARSTPPADLLVMHDVLEHIEDEASSVQAVARLLKPGGEGVISVPAYQWLFGLHDEMLGHYRRYTLGRLKKLFEEDFEIRHARYFGSLFIPITLWFSRIRRKAYPFEAASRDTGQRVMRAMCTFQRKMPEPFGTSAVIHVRRRLVH